MLDIGVAAQGAPLGRLVPHPFGIFTHRIGPSGIRRWRSHVHVEHELLWGASAELQAVVSGTRWLVPPTVGMWIPGNVRHEVAARPGTTFYCSYFRPESFPHDWTQPDLLAVSSLLREVLLHLYRHPMDEEARLRAEQVGLDVMQPLRTSAVELPMPSDPRARAVAEALIANPADPRSLAEWAASVGGSSRTLTRVFAQGTGMSFSQWRIHLRVRASMAYLAAGVAVSTVSRRVGYTDASAFVSVFRRVTGRTPGSYFASAPDLADGDWSLPQVRDA